jgi:hypothetical protein
MFWAGSMVIHRPAPFVFGVMMDAFRVETVHLLVRLFSFVFSLFDLLSSPNRIARRSARPLFIDAN